MGRTNKTTRAKMLHQTRITLRWWMVNLKVKYVALRLNARNAIKKMSCHCKYITPVPFVRDVKSYSYVNASKELHCGNKKYNGRQKLQYLAEVVWDWIIEGGF